MLEAKKRMVYKAFGLNINSEIALPELLRVNVPEELVDVVIELGDLSALWSEASDPNEDFVISENLCMFMNPDVAIYSVQEGKKIIVSPVKGSSEDIIRLYILGTCMGAILLHRKILPLHGSAIAIEGKAYAFVGDSGAGKSTIASALLRKGYQLLSDDVIPVSMSKENIPMVTPAYPQQKLWLESLNQFGMTTSDYRPLFERDTKFAVPVQSQFVNKPLPLAGVIELVKTENSEIDMHPILNLERFYTLFNHTYRNFLIAQSGLMDWHFNASASIVNKIDLYQLRRPSTRFTANELVDLILETIKKEEKVYE
jgi:hypothetical protein